MIVYVDVKDNERMGWIVSCGIGGVSFFDCLFVPSTT